MDSKAAMGQEQQQYQQPIQQPDMAYQSNGPSQEKLAHNHQSSWTFGLFDCCAPMDICCLGYWCPCILFGKTQARLEGESEPSGVNMMCCAFCGLMYFGFNSCLQAVQRNNMRKKYGIEGSGIMDWVSSCCCACCALVQEEKEALLKTTGVDPKTKQQYQAPAGMAYP